MTARTESTTTPATLAADYAAALQDYVAGAGEAALLRAYELGRRAASDGVGLLELALVHHDALQRLRPGAAAVEPSTVAMASQFLAESLSPFEMTLRSYQENTRTLGLGAPAQADSDMERAREQLRTILDATTAVIYLKDAEGRYLFVNRRFQEVFGVERERVLGKLDHETLPVEVAEMLRGDDALVLAARTPREVEELLPGADGEHTWLALKFPLLDARGAPYGLSCVATDITERKRADEALRRAQEAAERERQLKHAVEVRDRFLGIASHELKTPLTSLELQIQSLLRLGRANGEVSLRDERVLQKCDAILRSVGRLTDLINDLLDLGKVASGQLGLAPERLDLAELVRKVLAGSDGAIRISGSRVALQARAEVVGTWDRRRMEAVVASLLSNALKFGEGKPVEVTVDRDGARAVLSVRDEGMGISDEDQQRIFRRFERAVSEQHFGGFGLGLWVAREVVEAHGGTIAVSSTLGRGATFRVELPLEPGGGA